LPIVQKPKALKEANGLFKRKKPVNLLSMRPSLNEHYSLIKSGDSETLVIPRTSWIEKIGVRWLNQAAGHRYRLDPLSSFVLKRCNGEYTVGEIEADLRTEFGEAAEPTLNRLVKFLQILDNNYVISLRENSLPGGQEAQTEAQ
jgi:hypothetical protein